MHEKFVYGVEGGFLGKADSASFSINAAVEHTQKRRMSILCLFFLVIITPEGYANNYDIQKLALELLSRNFIRQITVFACWDNDEQVSFYRQSLASDFKLSYISMPPDVLDMGKMLTVNYYTLGILLDLDCPKSDSVLKQFSEQRLPYNQTYRWILVTKVDTPPLAILKDLPLTIDTEMTVAVNNKSAYILYDVYNPSYRHGGSLNVTLMGKWSQDKGLEIFLTQYKYVRRGNLAGLALNVSIALLAKPFPDLHTYLTTPINRHLDTMHRYHYSLIQHLAEYYNFKINLKLTNTWGYLRNGSFTGMLGDMVAGIADIGGTPLVFFPERIDAAEYTVQTYVAKTCFIFRHPKKKEARNGFFRPFTDDVWLFTSIVASITWFLLFLAARTEIFLQDSQPISTLTTHPASETALITAAALCQQGLSDGPQLISGRLVFLSLFLWALLLFQYYSASIVGSLLAEPPRFIKTLKDLVDSPLVVAVEEIAYMHNLFAITTDPVAIELYKKKIGPAKGRPKQGNFFELYDGVHKVQKGNFAFHLEATIVYKYITEKFTEDQICDLEEIPLVPPQHLGTVTSKHSPFKKMVTYGMRQIIESGISERQKDIWVQKRPHCPESHSSNPVAVPLEEFSPALLFLSVGLLVAASVFLGENSVKWYSRRHLITVEARTGVSKVQSSQFDLNKDLY